MHKNEKVIAQERYIEDLTTVFFKEKYTSSYTAHQLYDELYNYTVKQINNYNYGEPSQKATKNSKIGERYPNMRLKEEFIPLVKNLTVYQIAMCVKHYFNFKQIRVSRASTNKDSSTLLARYINDKHSKNYGTYLYSEDDFAKCILTFTSSITEKDIKTYSILLNAHTEIIEQTLNPDLIAFNNSIFNYKTKELIEFDEKYVFLQKIGYDIKEEATNPIIQVNETETWDIETWINELSDDPETVNLFYEVLNAILRPSIAWDKMLWFYATTGNNGKGTFCKLITNILGDCYTSLSMGELTTDFKLGSIVGKQAIISDENAVEISLKEVAQLKALITGDPVILNRKFIQPIQYSFRGLIVQCVNDLPKIKDKTESMYRRLIIVEFDKCFTSIKNPYIKSDYLGRKDVIEYIIHKVMYDMPYFDKFSESKSSNTLLSRYKLHNDPVREFAAEIFPQLRWDLIPNEFLFSLYKKWWLQTQAGRTMYTSKQNFLSSISQCCLEFGFKRTITPLSTKKYITEPEYLIEQFGMEDWINTEGGSSDIRKRCLPLSKLKDSQKGFLRIDLNEKGGTI